MEETLDIPTFPATQQHGGLFAEGQLEELHRPRRAFRIHTAEV